MGSYEVPQENQKYNSWMIINQLSISIISLGLIFRPDLIFKSLVQDKEKNEAVLFGSFIIFILSTLIIVFPKYNPLLGKCIILGICGILNDKTWLEYLDSNKEKKISLLITLLNFVVKHKDQKIIIFNKLIEKELESNCLDYNTIYDEKEDKESDTDLNEIIGQIIKGNDYNINKDEFKYFSQIMKSIRENNKEVYNSVINLSLLGNFSFIEELFKVRNIKIKYNNKEFTVPRRIVRITRNLK